MKPNTKLICLAHILAVSLSLAMSLNVAARSIESDRFAENDPMMALPSSEEAHQQLANQEVHYVSSQSRPEYVIEYQPQMQVVSEPAVLAHQVGAQQTIVYQQQPASEPASAHQPAAPYQLIQVPVEVAQAGQTQQQPHEDRNQLVSVQEPASARGEYQGEIVYVQGQAEQPGEQQRDTSASAISSVADSGLSATILTEVPIKDMPYEVLNKLRREFGVKVVATRERPGANLVINCEDYPGVSDKRETRSSICAKQAQGQTRQLVHYPAAFEFAPTVSELTHEQHQHQPAGVEQHYGQTPDRRELLFHINHEANPQEPAHVYSQHEPEVHTVYSSGEELVHQQHAYQHHRTRQSHHSGAPMELEHRPLGGESHSTTVGATAEPQPQPQHPTDQSQYYGSRTATTPTVEEQPTSEPASEPIQPTEADQVQPHTATAGEPATVEGPQTTSAAYTLTHEQLDQNVGFDEQPKSGEHLTESRPAYRAESQ